MKNEKVTDPILQYIPNLTIWYKLLILYVFQISIFIISMIFLWWISSIILIGALIGEFLIVFFGTLPYRYIVNNIEKIRDKYKKKYKKLASQYLWYRFESYTIPLLSSSLYFPLLLTTYDYPNIQLTYMPSYIITKSLLPIYITIPVGLMIIIIGLLIRRPPEVFGPKVEIYLNLLYPEKGILIKNGIYKYIRHPRYLGRGFIAVGLGVIANNIIAILVGVIHFLIFCSLIRSEDKELLKRFGGEFKKYKKSVPALFPKYGNWKKIFIFIFSKKNKNND